MSILKFIVSFLYMLPYRLFFTKINIFSYIRDSKIDKRAAVGIGSRVYSSYIGKYSFVGKNTFVYRSTIGAFTSISNNCYIGSLSHPIDWVSTSPVFHVGRNVLRKNFAMHEFIAYKQTVIGNDVWIGEGCKIKAGVSIGDGAIIGMGSVVTKDIEPYAICAGNPAKKIRDRFEEDTIKKIIDSKWWLWDDEKIAHFSNFFNNPFLFVSKIEDIEK